MERLLTMLIKEARKRIVHTTEIESINFECLLQRYSQRYLRTGCGILETRF